MELEHVTFSGPPIDDTELLAKLPDNLRGLLQQINGFIQFHGGFHVRGASREPSWHSLRDAWEGASAFHRLYPAVRSEDVPFAEDCLGDQFLLRDRRVWRLAAETGDVEALEVGLGGFFEAVAVNPVQFLSLNPLLQYMREGGTLEPGQMLAAFPPFCTKQAAEGVSLAAVSAAERRRFLADLAAHLRDVPEGGRFNFRVAE